MKKSAAALALGLAAFLSLATPDQAQAQAQYNVGDHVAAPVGAQFFEAVVVQVNSNPLSYRVHPLGFAKSADFTANPQMLRPLGSVPVAPQGDIKE